MISVRMDVFTIELIHWASDIGVLKVLQRRARALSMDMIINIKMKTMNIVKVSSHVVCKCVNVDKNWSVVFIYLI